MHGAMAVTETAPVEPFGLERVFREHQGRVFRAAYRITGNVHDAEDVLQTVFLRLARQGEGFAALDNPASYLYRAAINAALDVLRGRRERPDLPIDAADAEGRGENRRGRRSRSTRPPSSAPGCATPWRAWTRGRPRSSPSATWRARATATSRVRSASRA